MPFTRPVLASVLVALLAACGGNTAQPASHSPQRAPAGLVDIGEVKVVQRDDCSIPSDRRLLKALEPQEGGIRKENEVADLHGLPRFANVEQIKDAIKDGELHPIGETEAYAFDQTFAEVDPENRQLYQHAQPHVRPFLDDLLSEGYRCFKEDFATAEYKSFLLSSMTRHDLYQKVLKRTNRNAAKGTRPENRTVHTTGAAVDISGALLPVRVRNWLRYRLAKLEEEGVIQATEEHRKGSWQYCFHVMVFPPGHPQKSASL